MRSGSLGYPCESPLVRLELYNLHGQVTYEQEAPPPKSDASATNAVIQQLYLCERTYLYCHYVWHRYRLKAKEKARRLGVSRATYYRGLGEAKRQLANLLELD